MTVQIPLDILKILLGSLASSYTDAKLVEYLTTASTFVAVDAAGIGSAWTVTDDVISPVPSSEYVSLVTLKAAALIERTAWGARQSGITAKIGPATIQTKALAPSFPFSNEYDRALANWIANNRGFSILSPARLAYA